MKGTNTLYKNIYNKYRRLILMTYFVGWIVVTIAEVIIGMMTQAQNGLKFDFPFALKFVVLPATIDLIAILIIYATFRSKKTSETVKNYILVFMMLVISFMLATVHSYFPVTYGFFLAPVIITVAFVDPFLTLVSGAFSLIFLWICALLCNVFDNVYDKQLHYMNAAVGTIMLIIITFAVLVFVNIHRDREMAIARYRKDNHRLSREASVDGLTQLYNHSRFYNDLEKVLEESPNRRRVFCLCVIDIDDFKTINDMYGHSQGDLILRQIAKILKTTLKETGTCYRYGGDEFSAILNCDVRQAEDLLEDALVKVRMIREESLEGRQITLSIGLHPVSNFAQSAEEVFATTDRVLYLAKSSGKNQIAVR